MTSRLGRGEAVAALVWLPVHVLLLPVLMAVCLHFGLVSDAVGELLVYVIGAAYMLLALRRFFRRDFDRLCDEPLRLLSNVFIGYWIAWIGELLAGLLLQALGFAGSGGNNESVIEMAQDDFARSAAMIVLLAPIVEEGLFRAGIFGLLRRKSRPLAYTVSALLFALYHVWGYALEDPRQLLYGLLYLPPAIALARAYERSDSIWGAVFLHMLLNAVALFSIRAG